MSHQQRPQPGWWPTDRCARKAPSNDCVPSRYLVPRQLSAEVHPPYFPHHFHADHLMFSCSESKQKQLNTWAVFGQRQQSRVREPLIYSIFRPGNALEALIYLGATAGF
ncbi:hypothetical protein ALP90_01701 [Pseudomonas amygdali pv. ulmi]|uniref:Uncharacterized protein n=1 Tax=Pseudomonas amygdali pv. ulmi TaxID=251720 RepID=A0A3M4T8B1_PSEA0|nr:hypothetical protein ALP90_01701 [Pseudomonas amygdali pv. ulmi]